MPDRAFLVYHAQSDAFTLKPDTFCERIFTKAVHADASLTQVGERQMSNAEADCASLSLVPRSHLHFKP
ncbi:jg6098 [Pararge aegeria aegeria]|uniref:Jg6098 protein n=1 Tax=Pararge aegeria aegeria TaxID=348720 RepID=A0A8S4S9J2_9NEOP|nr:jg6098 [Pararge aegeria aegeria]